MSDSKLDIVSLNFRVEQLEERLNKVAQYSGKLKRQLESLTEAFNTRPELQQFESLQQEVMVLREHLNSLVTDSPVEESSDSTLENLQEVVRQFLERVDKQLSQESLKGSKLSQNPEQGVAQAEENCRILSDEEFKSERILLLLGFYEGEDVEIELKSTISAREFLERKGRGQKDFSNTDMQGIDLSGQFLCDINLENSTLMGVKLRGCTLEYTNFDFANLQHADFSNARTNYRIRNGRYIYQPVKMVEANLENAILFKTQLQEALLSKTNFKKASLNQAVLEGANLSQAELCQADLSFSKLSKANLSQANLYQVDLANANLSRADLTRANLQDANLTDSHLRTATLLKANLNNANLARANLLGATFGGANLKGASLQQAIYDKDTWFPREFDITQAGAYLIAPGTSLEKVDLSSRNLIQCNLSGANLHGADLRTANLNNANLAGADLTEADLRATNLQGADLTGANLTGAKLGGANLSSAKLTGAIMPDGSISE
jgi:uncharacterized protein YjbI with pentapeptide repeats